MMKKNKQQKDIIRKRNVRNKYKRQIYLVKARFASIIQDVEQGRLSIGDSIELLKKELEASKKRFPVHVITDGTWTACEEVLNAYRERNES